MVILCTQKDDYLYYSLEKPYKLGIVPFLSPLFIRKQ